MKICGGCKENKTDDSFYPRWRKAGLRPHCKACDAKRKHGYRITKLPQIIASQTRWRNNNRERHNEYHRNYKARLQGQRKLKMIEDKAKNNRQFRYEAVQHYGGYCACCGESQFEFLCIDHVNGNGAEHRKSIKVSIYRWLERNNYPEGFQILCYNCNMAKSNGKECPHARVLLTLIKAA